jgi:hypothetical protein
MSVMTLIYVEYAGFEGKKEPEPEETHFQSEQQQEPENEDATSPIQPEKKNRRGFVKFFSNIFKPKKQEPEPINIYEVEL